MSAVCDYCGQKIDAACMTLNLADRCVGRYHAECSRRIRELIESAHSYGTLETVPTISAEDVADRRRRHTFPGATWSPLVAEMTRLSSRTSGALLRAEILTSDDLCSAIMDRSLRSVRGIGPKAVGEITEALKELLRAAWTEEYTLLRRLGEEQ